MDDFFETRIEVGEMEDGTYLVRCVAFIGKEQFIAQKFLEEDQTVILLSVVIRELAEEIERMIIKYSDKKK